MGYGRLGQTSFGRGGFHGYRGLGTAASDAAYGAAVSSYNADHAAWLNEKAAYDKAYQAFVGMSSGAASGYQVALNNYARALAQWAAANAAYQAAVLANLRQQQTNSLAQMKASALAESQGAVIPAGYSGCVTSAQHDNWYSLCNNPTVKGLGGPIPTGPYCALASLAVCPPPLTAPPPNPGAKPVPPAPPPAFSPPAPIRPEPQPPAPPPVSVATPSPSPAPSPIPAPQSTPAPLVTIAPSPTPPAYVSVPNPSSVIDTTPVTPPKKTGGLLSNGLLLVVCGGVGYALYRTFKKPKSAAA